MGAYAGPSVTAAPSRGHADMRTHLTLQPEGGGDPTAGLAPTRRAGSGGAGAADSLPPGTCRLCTCFILAATPGSGLCDKGALSVGRVPPGTRHGVSLRCQRWLLGCTRRHRDAPVRAPQGVTGSRERGGGGRRRASSPRPVPGSSRSGLAPPWELCVPTSVGLSLGRGKRPASRRQGPPLGIPVSPAVGVLPNPRPQHADGSGARAPGSGAGDREVLGIREPRDTGALSPGAVPPAPGVLQCYFRC